MNNQELIEAAKKIAHGESNAIPNSRMIKALVEELEKPTITREDYEKSVSTLRKAALIFTMEILNSMEGV